MITYNIKVKKASGYEEDYSEEKLRGSLSRSGASEQMISQILKNINSKLYSGIPTKKIHKIAMAMLRRQSHGYAARYDLKKGIMALGPSGFPFEKYVGSIFEWQGYTVITQQLIKRRMCAA